LLLLVETGAHEANLFMRTGRYARKAEQKLYVFLFVCALTVELEPIVKVLVDLIVWLTSEGPSALNRVSAASRQCREKGIFSLLKISAIHSLDFEVLQQNFLLFYKLFEVLSPQG